MKPKIRTPYFEIGVKNYVYGDDVLKMALHADACAEKYNVDVAMIVPYTELRRVCEQTKHLYVFAPYMDTLRPGRGMADVLPEAIKATGAIGVVINHCEKPMTLPQMRATIDRARELDLLVFGCADSIAETKALAELHPDIINPEPNELIGGGGGVSSADYVQTNIRAVKDIYEDIIVEQAAGVSSPKEVYDFIYAGCEATGAASGIFKAADPYKMAEDMIAAVRKAIDDRKANGLD